MMKRILLPVLVLVVGGLLRAATPSDFKISAVTVYPRGAVITRVGSVTLPAGDREVVFENLPENLAEETLQVGGRGDSPVTILDVIARERHLDATPNERIRAIEDEQAALQRQRRVITDRSAVLDKEQVLLTQIATDAGTPVVSEKESSRPQLNLSEAQQVIDFYNAGLEKVALEQRTLDRQREDLDAKISALNAQLDQLRNGREKTVMNVIVHLNVGQAGKFEITLSYAVPGAGWAPVYDARLSTGDQKLVLGYFGMVSQSTGEDWKGVPLTLSTALPSLAGEQDLNPWILSKLVPVDKQTDQGAGVTVLAPFEAAPAPPGSYRLMGAMNGGAAGDEAQLKRKKQDFTQQNAAVHIGATSSTFHIPTPADVPSDHFPHRIGIATLPIDTQLTYSSTPKLLPSAFLTAAATNHADYPLLDGSVSAFLDGVFVSKTELKTVMPGEKFKLGFGADDGIRVERKLINQFTKGAGILTDATRISYDFLTTVTNSKSSSVTIAVTDQLPVSRDEKIKVEQVEPDTDQIKPDNQGMIVWKLDLKPGEKRELPLKFNVTYPQGFPIDGL